MMCDMISIANNLCEQCSLSFYESGLMHQAASLLIIRKESDARTRIELFNDSQYNLLPKDLS